MHYICYVTAAYIDVYLEFPTLSLALPTIKKGNANRKWFDQK